VTKFNHKNGDQAKEEQHLFFGCCCSFKMKNDKIQPQKAKTKNKLKED
jgi:hypothetical protein